VATFRLQVFYQIGEGGKWSNVYHVSGSDLAEVVAAFSTDMLPGLLPVLHASARIVKILASSLTDASFLEQPISAFGTSAATDGRLPLWNCVRALISTDAPGRPDVKFLKGYLTEGTIAVDLIEAAAVSVLSTNFNAIISSMTTNGTPLVSESGDLWLTAVIQPEVQMRQMHRKRKKTVTP